MLEYMDSVRAAMDKIAETQFTTIELAAATISKSLLNGGVLYCHDIGHGLQGDFLHRAGGMAALRAFTFKFDIKDSVAPPLSNRPRDGESIDRTIEMVRLAVRTSTMRRGDVILLGSVSGRNIIPVEMALACREIGVKTVAFTAFEYTVKVPSLHPTGTRLKDAVDFAIDIGAPYGDATTEIPGYDIRLLPVSGVGTLVAGWVLMGETMRLMSEAGQPATVFQSFNSAGGAERLDLSHKQYDERGF